MIFSGVKNVFKIWCCYHSVVMFNVFLISNVYICVITRKNNPDLWNNGLIIKRNSIDHEEIHIHGMERRTKIPRKAFEDNNGHGVEDIFKNVKPALRDIYIHGMEGDTIEIKQGGHIEQDIQVQDI